MTRHLVGIQPVTQCLLPHPCFNTSTTNLLLQGRRGPLLHLPPNLLLQTNQPLRKNLLWWGSLRESWESRTGERPGSIELVSAQDLFQILLAERD